MSIDLAGKNNYLNLIIQPQTCHTRAVAPCPGPFASKPQGAAGIPSLAHLGEVGLGTAQLPYKHVRDV